MKEITCYKMMNSKKRKAQYHEGINYKLKFFNGSSKRVLHNKILGRKGKEKAKQEKLNLVFFEIC
jgi:hypothetical protein